MTYLFCQFENAESVIATTTLGCLIQQCLDVDTLPHSIESRLADILRFSCPDANELGVLLRDVLGNNKASFIVIDAIDECTTSERSMLLKVLQNIMNSSPNVVKFFLAARHGIMEEVVTSFKPWYHVKTSFPGARSDRITSIEDYLAIRENNRHFFVGNPELLNDIKDALVKGANGTSVFLLFPLKYFDVYKLMFLWVAFQMEDICSQICDGDIRQVIGHLPEGLSETYFRALARINRIRRLRFAKRSFLGWPLQDGRYFLRSFEKPLLWKITSHVLTQKTLSMTWPTSYRRGRRTEKKFDDIFELTPEALRPGLYLENWLHSFLN